VIFVGIGSNLKSEEGLAPLTNCQKAVDQMISEGIEIVARSPWYETAPVPVSYQPWYVNGVVEIKTPLSAAKILPTLLNIESVMGRVRSESNAARTIDLDLLAYDDECMATVNLILPHPRLHTRLFVLRPLADIAPDWRHPRSGEKLDDMLKKVHKAQEIRKIG